MQDDDIRKKIEEFPSDKNILFHVCCLLKFKGKFLGLVYLIRMEMDSIKV